MNIYAFFGKHDLVWPSFPRKRESICFDAKAKMDSSLLKAVHVHVLSPRTRFRGNDGLKSLMAFMPTLTLHPKSPGAGPNR
jgi:hypothetical protein